MLRRALAEAGDAVPDTLPRAVLVQSGEAPGWLVALLKEHDIPLLRDAADLEQHKLDPLAVLAHGELSADLRARPAGGPGPVASPYPALALDGAVGPSGAGKLGRGSAL